MARCLLFGALLLGEAAAYAKAPAGTSLMLQASGEEKLVFAAERGRVSPERIEAACAA